VSRVVKKGVVEICLLVVIRHDLYTIRKKSFVKKKIIGVSCLGEGEGVSLLFLALIKEKKALLVDSELPPSDLTLE